METQDKQINKLKYVVEEKLELINSLEYVIRKQRDEIDLLKLNNSMAWRK